MTEPVSKLREDSLEPIRNFSAHLGVNFALIMSKIGHDELFRNCGKCRFWRDIPETYGLTKDGPPLHQGCNLYHAIPPVKVIVCGCASFEDMDEIPF